MLDLFVGLRLRVACFDYCVGFDLVSEFVGGYFVFATCGLCRWLRLLSVVVVASMGTAVVWGSCAMVLGLVLLLGWGLVVLPY